MKKLIALLISGVIMLPCVNAFANDVIEVYIDGEKLECDVNPKNIDERVLVPMRAIFEAFGANVSWDNNGRTVWVQTQTQIPRQSLLEASEDISFPAMIL